MTKQSCTRLKINICPFFILWLNQQWHTRHTIENLGDNFREVIQIQFDFWQEDVIYKTEHAYQWNPNLHNEDTFISASTVFDIPTWSPGRLKWKMSIYISRKMMNKIPITFIWFGQTKLKKMCFFKKIVIF